MKKIILIFVLFIVYFTSHAAGEFVTTWKTDNTGVSAANQITIPGGGNYSVYWEDVNNPAINGTTSGSGSQTITFPAAGTYRVKMQAIAPSASFSFNMPANTTLGDAAKLLTVEEWGTNAWANMANAFYGCINMDVTATDIPNFSNVTNMSFMFFNCAKLIGNATINNWNTSRVTAMNSMFSKATLFNQPINNWNTANVTNMSSMFSEASNFNQPIGTWNTAKVTNMSVMFNYASSFNQSISTWNTGLVTNFYLMFAHSNFNQNINNWNTANARDFSWMFWGNPVYNQPMDQWNTGNARTMSRMFYQATIFNQNLNSWNTANVTDMAFMFGSTTKYNQPMDLWNTANVLTMMSMFQVTDVFNQPLNIWNTTKVTDMSSMFLGAKAFNQPLNQWNTSSVQKMNGMFQNATVFDQNLGNWNLSSITPPTGSGSAITGSLVDMFNYSGLKCINYDATLIGWANAATTPNNMRLGSAGRVYSNADAVAARTTLITTKGWTITGDTYDPACNVPLPVTFDAIKAVIKDGNLHIEWSTLSETNNDHFDIEISKDGKSFIKIGALSSKAANGNSAIPLNYEFDKGLSDSISLFGFSFMLILLIVLLFANRKKNIVFIVITMLLVSSVFNFSCNKNKETITTSSDTTIFVRIKQVDKDNTAIYSKTIKAIPE